METLESKVEETVKKVLMTDLKDMLQDLLKDSMNNMRSMAVSTNPGEADTAKLNNTSVLDRARQPSSNGNDHRGPTEAAAEG